jgi:hypothetical protein
VPEKGMGKYLTHNKRKWYRGCTEHKERI